MGYRVETKRGVCIGHASVFDEYYGPDPYLEIRISLGRGRSFKTVVLKASIEEAQGIERMLRQMAHEIALAVDTAEHRTKTKRRPSQNKESPSH